MHSQKHRSNCISLEGINKEIFLLKNAINPILSTQCLQELQDIDMLDLIK